MSKHIEITSAIPDERIVKFIRDHHLLALSTVFEGKPWSASCFYVYDEEKNYFIFTSDLDTRHAQEMEKNNHVSGIVALETSVVGKIQGIQLSGKVWRAEGDALKSATKKYMLKYPMAMLMKTTLWILEADHIKMTDNRLGFGKKLIWKSDKQKTH